MKSVGETMGIGRTFTEAFLKAKRSREIDDEWNPEGMHPWFVAELEPSKPRWSAVRSLDDLVASDWLRLKRLGLSDGEIAVACCATEGEVRSRRRRGPSDPFSGGWTRAAARSRPSRTTLYSTWGEADEAPPEPGRSVVILGSGPNRIGQGSSSTTAASTPRRPSAARPRP